MPLALTIFWKFSFFVRRYSVIILSMWQFCNYARCNEDWSLPFLISSHANRRSFQRCRTGRSVTANKFIMKLRFLWTWKSMKKTNLKMNGVSYTGLINRHVISKRNNLISFFSHAKQKNKLIEKKNQRKNHTNIEQIDRNKNQKKLT